MKITPSELTVLTGGLIMAASGAAAENPLLRAFSNRMSRKSDAATATATDGASSSSPLDAIPSAEDGERQLQSQSGCWGNSGTAPAAAWHPTYSAGWTNGYCQLNVDCNSPSYSSQLNCCKSAYRGQISGKCLAGLPNPPTSSPTKGGGLDVYYPDYATPWAAAYCINTGPLPSGRPTYTTMLACCKGAYAGQVSGKCLAMLPNPPTSSPTKEGGLDVYYPDYRFDYAEGRCINDGPLPTGRPNYPSHLACCKAAYPDQQSGLCLSLLGAPPTMSPTPAGGFDFWYPDYETPWANAGCKNTRPLPFLHGGRPTYDTQLACCKGAYAGQVSGVCLGQLASPPTTSPTGSGALDVYYKPPNGDFATGVCTNARPAPQWQPTYATKSECCSAQFRGQFSMACICDVNPCANCKCAGATVVGACPNLTCTP